jgi:predicted transposase/invertase (TIGR01784 family)
MQKAAKLIDDDRLTPQERMAIIDERDYNNMRRKEWEDGLEIGRIAEKQEIARNLLAEGVELTLIAKTTGLSVAEIEALT